jgi:2-keto-3-deoxy-L-rhamnonate aldolase RhmA
MAVAVVENTTGLSHIDDIAATPGIDVLFIGTSDLSFSLGLRGQQDHPRLEEAIGRIVAAGERNGKILGRPGHTPEQIKRFQEQGFRFFMSGTDTAFMAAGAARLLAPLGKTRRFSWGNGV